jgi:hypothetical protein
MNIKQNNKKEFNFIINIKNIINLEKKENNTQNFYEKTLELLNLKYYIIWSYRKKYKGKTKFSNVKNKIIEHVLFNNQSKIIIFIKYYYYKKKKKN